jgi:hypothetical protein
MAFRQNYGSKRAERNRAQRTRNEEKLKARQERSAQRKAEREVPASELVPGTTNAKDADE